MFVLPSENYYVGALCVEGGYKMNILKKLVSFALTAAVVAGIGSTSFAAETSVNIAKTFPDKNLRKVVSKYDKDNNGTLSLAEMKKFTELSIWSEDCVEDLTGIDKLKYTTRLIVFEGDMETINLSKCDNIEYANIICTNQLTSFTGGWGLEYLELSFCTKLSSLDLSRSYNLETFKFIRNTKFRGTVDLNASPYLEHVELLDLNCTGVRFNKGANLKYIECTRTKIESLNLSVMNFNTLTRVFVYDNPNLRSLYLPSNSFSVLMSHRTNDGYSYRDSKRSISISTK